VIHTDGATAPSRTWIGDTLGLMAAEVRQLRPGGEAVITRLADILVIQAIRAWIEADPAAQTGWLGALRDPQFGYGSEAAFSHAFKRVIGVSPGAVSHRSEQQLAPATARNSSMAAGTGNPREGATAGAAVGRRSARTQAVRS
jgi:hypothetical protein